MSTAKQDESIYMQCVAAIDRLVESPPVKKWGVGIFTELDVLGDANRDDWGNAQVAEAMHEANEICGQRYRAGKLCRYGPVVIERGSSKIEDHARIAGKIVYADAVSGPEEWVTPNGTFKKLLAKDDTLTKQGRTQGSKRSDNLPWDEQVLPMPPASKPKRKAQPKKRGTVRSAPDYDAMIADLTERVEELENEIAAMTAAAVPA